MREFDTGATRDTAENKLHYAAYLSPQAIERFAQYMKGHEVQADGQRRKPDNWKKGIPMEAYEDSMMRHVMEFRLAVEEGRLMDAEEIMCAVMFNVQGWLHERVKSRVWGTASDVTFPIPGDMGGGTQADDFDVASPQPETYEMDDRWDNNEPLPATPDMDRATQPENALADPRVTKREYPAPMETTRNALVNALDTMLNEPKKNMSAQEVREHLAQRPQMGASTFFEDTPFKNEPRELWDARQQRPQPGLDPSKGRL